MEEKLGVLVHTARTLQQEQLREDGGEKVDGIVNLLLPREERVYLPPCTHGETRVLGPSHKPHRCHLQVVLAEWEWLLPQLRQRCQQGVHGEAKLRGARNSLQRRKSRAWQSHQKTLKDDGLRAGKLRDKCDIARSCMES